MKRRMMAGTIATLGFLCTVSQGALLVEEGFNSSNGDLNGKSITSTGLTANWSTTAAKYYINNSSTFTSAPGAYQFSAPQAYVQATGWSVYRASRAMSTAVDMSVDGTYYASFYVTSNTANIVAEVGFDNGTNELLAGSCWNGNTWLTAYSASIASNTTSSWRPGTTPAAIFGTDLTTACYVLKFTKTNSSTTNNLSIEMDVYNLGTPSTPNALTLGTPTTVITATLTGVTESYDNLVFKLAGGYPPSLDEIRIGTTLSDVAPVPEPASLSLIALAGLLLLGRRRSRD